MSAPTIALILKDCGHSVHTRGMMQEAGFVDADDANCGVPLEYATSITAEIRHPLLSHCRK